MHSGGVQDRQACCLHLLYYTLACVCILALFLKPQISQKLCAALACGMSTCPDWDTVHAVNQTADKPYYLFDGYAHLAAGLACGLAGLAAGMAIGIVGDAGVRWVSSAAAPAVTEVVKRSPCVTSVCVREHVPLYCIPSFNTYKVNPNWRFPVQGKCPAAQALCRNDPDPHFRRGSGPIWTDRCALVPFIADALLLHMHAAALIGAYNLLVLHVLKPLHIMGSG